MARDGDAAIEPAQSARVLILLDALAGAGLIPSSARAIHEVAYLANVLSPVFDLHPLDAKLLKRASGPYYPELQQAIDRLVGRGLVEALDLRYDWDVEEKRYRVVASYRLRRERAQAALTRYGELFAVQTRFLHELASAYSALADAAQGRASLQDARYADAAVDVDNVIDFGEWADATQNFSTNAALAFAPGRHLQPAERLYLYLDHLHARVAHAG